MINTKEIFVTSMKGVRIVVYNAAAGVPTNLAESPEPQRRQKTKHTLYLMKGRDI